ncbi:MAG TPA: hypothetical protein VFY39_14535 [Gammaproteobacteria bacterium]|nr:hypothetical protein [Gammaproteobacteria bacterium]
MKTNSERPNSDETGSAARLEKRPLRHENLEADSPSAEDLEAERLARIEGTPESLANTPSEAGKAPPGHPAESPRGWGLLVTIVGLIIIAIIIWAVFF